MNDEGASFVESLIVLCLFALLGAMTWPVSSAALDEGRAQQAAWFVAGQFRDARQQAVTRSSSTALVFDQAMGRWLFRVCLDGNANGVRRADVRTGRDRCADPVDVAAMFPGVSLAIDPGIRGPEDEPPSGDAVRLGSSDMASFAPSGSCSGGSLFLRSAKGVQYAVRLAGATGRLRVLRYDAPARVWRTQ